MHFRVFLYHYSIILAFLNMIPEGGLSFDPHGSTPVYIILSNIYAQDHHIKVIIVLE